MTDLTPVAEGAEVVLTPGSAGFDLDVVVTALEGGGYVVAWRSSGLEDSSSGGVYAQVYAANGGPLGARILVNTTTAGGQFHPSITPLDGGGFAIAWVSRHPDVSTPKENIYMQRFDAAGVPQGGETLVNTLLDLTSQNQPSIAGLEGGGIVVTWKTADFFKSVDNSGGVLAQRFDANGERLGVEHQVNTTIPTSQADPSITALADGGYVITWTDSVSVINSGPLMDREDINGQRYTADGTPVGGEFTINTFRTDQQLQSAVTALESGGFVVVWQTAVASPNGTDVQFQIFDEFGVKVGGEVRVNTTVANTQEFPSVTGLADGGFVVSWTSRNQIADDPQVAYDVYGQRFDATGTALGSEFLINETTLYKQYQGAQQITLPAQLGLDQLQDGSLVAVWIDAGGNQAASGFAKVRQFEIPSDVPVNTAPSGTDATITFDEDTSHIFTLSDFGFTDADAGDELAAVTITSFTDLGALFLNGDFIGSGARVLASDIAAGQMSYDTVPDANGDNYSSFTFQVEDQNGALDASPNTITFNVTPINDAPEGTDKTTTFDEDTSHVFALSDFGFTDADAGDELAAVTITSFTDLGALFLNGDFIGSGTRVLASDIAAGQLSFDTVPDANGDNYSSFTFQVEDQNGGLDASPNTITFNVTPVDDVAKIYSPVGANFQVNTTPEDRQLDPSITGLAGGGFVVVWVDYSSVQPGEIGGNASIDVRGQVYNAAGEPAGGEFLVIADKVQDMPAVAALTDGGFVLVWRDYSDAAGNGGENRSDITAQRYAADGSTVGDAFLVNSTTYDTQDEPSVAGLANGGFVITWTDFSVGEVFNFQENSVIRGQVYDAAGNPVENEDEESFEFTINTSEEYAIRYGSKVVGLEDGGFAVAWTDFGAVESGDDNDDGAVMGRIFSNAGAALGDQFQMNTTSAAGQFDVSLAALTDGGFVAAWLDESDPGGGAAIVGQVFAADGAIVGDEFEIAPVNFFNVDPPSVSTMLDGGFVVTWQVPPGEGPPPMSIEGQVFAADGSLVGEQFTIDDDSAAYVGMPQVSGLIDGGFAATWISSTNEEDAQPGQDTSDSAITAQIFAVGGGDPYNGVTVNGGAGKDKINPLKALPGQPLPGALRDKLYGNDNDDSLDGGAGGDLMVGGAGNDKYTLDDVLDLVVEEAEGGDKDLMQSSVISLTLAANVENGTLLGFGDLQLIGNGLGNKLTGNDGENLIRGLGGKDNIKGNAGSDTIYGGADGDSIDGGSEADFLYGDEGKDKLSGGAGIDYLSGGEGDDTLDGGTEADTMEGGAGNDKYTVDDALDQVIENDGEGDKDLMQSSLADFALAANVENGTLSGDLDLDITGNDLANKIKGNDGNNTLGGAGGTDTITGGEGDDTISGGEDTDTLSGDEGSDTLEGDGGNDFLNGGLGEDTLRGGLGADRFTFDNDSLVGSVIDVIEDFSGLTGELDRISLSSIDANGIAGDGNQKFAFKGTGAFTGAGAEVRYFSLLGDTVIEADIDGDLTADLTIILTGGHTLQAGDFVL